MTQPPDWVTNVPGHPPVHTEPPKTQQWENLSQDQVRTMRGRLIESVIQVVVQAITGLFIPGGGIGGAQNQLTSWANNIPLIGPLVGAITGTVGSLFDLGNFFDLSGPGNLLTGLFDGVLGGSGNPISSFISSLLGTQSTASTAGTNASTALGNIVSLINGVVGGFGNPLSALISSLLGTQSTASTAGTNATTALGNWSTLLAGIPGGSTIANFLSFLLPGSGSNGIFAPLINGITGGTTNPLSALLSNLLGTGSTASTANTNASTGLGFIGNIWDGIFGAITNLGGTGYNNTDMVSAVGSQADAVTGTSAMMEQVLAGLGVGTPDADDFERSTLNPATNNPWYVMSTGSGSLTIPNAHDVSWSGTGSSSEFVARRNNGKVAQTNHQTSTVVLASGIPSYPLFTPFPYGGYIDLWVRMTAFTTYGTRTGYRFRVNGRAPYTATWDIDWVNAGSATNLWSGSMKIPASGASIAFEVGVNGNMRRMVARLNSTVIPGTDQTDSTDRGLGNYHRGFGGKGNSGIGTAQGVPKLKQWTAQG